MSNSSKLSYLSLERNKADGLMHDCGISIAKALEILRSCTKPLDVS